VCGSVTPNPRPFIGAGVLGLVTRYIVTLGHDVISL
jgi:hypothetical protein